MTKLDLRTRLVAAIAMIGLFQVVVGFVVISSARDQLIDQIDDRLAFASSADRGSSFDRDRGIEPHRDEHEEGGRPGSPERFGDTYEGVLSSDGTLLTFFAPNDTGAEFAPPDIDVGRAEASKGEPITVDATGVDLDYRLTAARIQGGEYFITAIPLNTVDHTMSELTTVVAVAAVAITALLLALTWWVLRLGIAPIKRMTASAEAIAAGDLSERVTDTDQRTEAGQLGHALNTMLGRIESSLAERTRAEEKLRQFIADASHELRTPVATIRGYAELYRAGGLADRSELDDAMRRTELESQRMSRLIADMLNLARLDREPDLQKRPVDLAVLVRDAVADARVAHPHRTITAVVDDAMVVVDGSEDLLRQVLANVTDNAIVHTDPPVIVTVTARTSDACAELEVADGGPGMTSEVLARVTERFYRADPARSRHQGGSGLGLAIAESIIAAHDGTLIVASTPGEGTTVTITMPLAATHR